MQDEVVTSGESQIAEQLVSYGSLDQTLLVCETNAPMNHLFHQEEELQG